MFQNSHLKMILVEWRCELEGTLFNAVIALSRLAAQPSNLDFFNKSLAEKNTKRIRIEIILLQYTHLFS